MNIELLSESDRRIYVSPNSSIIFMAQLVILYVECGVFTVLGLA